MGAWIEINTFFKPVSKLSGVAPHMGAWIEIQSAELLQVGFVSHPTWVRGLKY